MEFNLIIAFAIGMLILGLVMKVISLPLKLLKWFITNSIMGAIMLAIVNMFGLGLDINFISAMTAGVLGIPGVILIIILHFI